MRPQPALARRRKRRRRDRTDVGTSLGIEASDAGGRLKDHPELKRYLERIHARPAYQRAIEKGGPYRLMG